MNKLKGIAIAAAAAVMQLVATGAHAADYTSQIGATTTTIAADLATNAPAAVGLGLVIFGVLTGVGVLFKLLHRGGRG